MGRLIIHARYWNDMQWLAASLEHVDAWQADVVVIGEGNWDPAWPARSTDQTREMLDLYAAGRPNTTVIDNVREDKNYRRNQATTSNMAMKLAEARPGKDWMLIIDVDHFYFPSDIKAVRELIEKHGDEFDYITHYTRCFFDNLTDHEYRLEEKGTKLPYKLVEGCSWRATNQLTVKGKLYRDIPKLRPRLVEEVGMHYECMRDEKRLTDKYNIGNRRTPWAYKDGWRMRALRKYSGPHPVFARSVLREMGYDV
jgi:hypothetical protein